MKNIYDTIWGEGLKMISARMMNSEELRRKLLRKFPEDEDDISDVLREMKRVMLIDDRRYAEQLVRHITQRPVGRLKIMLEGRRRGINEEYLSEAMITIAYDEEKACALAAQNKAKTLREADISKKKFKLMNFLRNRGFSDPIVYSVINSIMLSRQ